MANFQTLRNSLKKLELKNCEDNDKEYCGVISNNDLEKIKMPVYSDKKRNRFCGYLLAPIILSEIEWEERYGN
jgi:hypothetical protein